jgi:predicted DNA-binding transcriptional regulator AlpA
MPHSAEVEQLAAKIGTVARVMDSSATTVRRRVRDDPDFPKPFRLVPGGEPRWWLPDVRTYLARKAGRPLAA